MLTTFISIRNDSSRAEEFMNGGMKMESNEGPPMEFEAWSSLYGKLQSLLN